MLPLCVLVDRLPGILYPYNMSDNPITCGGKKVCNQAFGTIPAFKVFDHLFKEGMVSQKIFCLRC